MKRFPQIFISIFIAMVITATLFEFTIRVLAPHWPALNALLYIPSLHTQFDDVKTLKSLMKNTVEGYHPFDVVLGDPLNSRSFRTKEYSEIPSSDTYRIVVLGDSFAYSSSKVILKEMWHAHLEEELHRRSNKPVEVLSLGVGAVGPIFELRLWELEGSLLHPNLVILAFFVGNDFTDEQDILATPYKWDFYLKRIATLRLLRNIGRLAAESKRERHFSELPQVRNVNNPPKSNIVVPDLGTFSAERYLSIETQRMSQYLKANRRWFDSLATKIDQVILRMNKEVLQSHSRFMVMIIPDEFQINSALRKDALKTLGCQENDFDNLLAQNHLKKLFLENNISFLDMEPIMNAKSHNQSFYWLRDTHWNIPGNRLAGTRLAEKIMDLDLFNERKKD